jgi:hypothetical protein
MCSAAPNLAVGTVIEMVVSTWLNEVVQAVGLGAMSRESLDRTNHERLHSELNNSTVNETHAMLQCTVLRVQHWSGARGHTTKHHVTAQDILAATPHFCGFMLHALFAMQV